MYPWPNANRTGLAVCCVLAPLNVPAIQGSPAESAAIDDGERQDGASTIALSYASLTARRRFPLKLRGSSRPKLFHFNNDHLHFRST